MVILLKAFALRVTWTNKPVPQKATKFAVTVTDLNSKLLELVCNTNPTITNYEPGQGNPFFLCKSERPPLTYPSLAKIQSDHYAYTLFFDSKLNPAMSKKDWGMSIWQISSEQHRQIPL